MFKEHDKLMNRFTRERVIVEKDIGDSYCITELDSGQQYNILKVRVEENFYKIN